MTVRIPVSADTLGRSRFAICAATETVGGIRRRALRRQPAHLRRRLDRAATGAEPRSLELLHGLIPHDHPYTPDFLTPSPGSALVSVERAADVVRRTPPDEVEHHLDIAFRGRAIRPEVAAAFPSAAAYERWRRPMPPSVADALRAGPAALASRAADALVDYFTAALAPEWDAVRAVLQDDVSHRAEKMAGLGAGAMIDDLGDGVRWRDGEIRIARPYDVVVDWATDGFVLVPSTAVDAQVLFSAEHPRPPVLTYPARGVSRLWGSSPEQGDDALRELIGETRAMLLAGLDEPRSTSELSRDMALAPATVSYHLGILRRARLVRSRRRRRVVLYQRCPLGTRLLGRDPGDLGDLGED
ncbi:winged helix-turn-helix domain-containing protein [Streptomyces sp. NPDC054847]